jgi:hypothetical protein
MNLSALGAGPAPRIVVLEPSAFSAKYTKRPQTAVAIGIRPLAFEDAQAALASAAEDAQECRGDATDRYAYQTDALMAHAVAAASCDPNNASRHYWECGADSVREALTPAAVRRLWDELELVTVETSATRAEATEGDRERLARLLRGRRWRSFAGNAPSGKVTRLLKVIRFALEEIESANAAE